MSGHSKWANIKRKKAKMDAVKGNVFSRLTKEIMAAAKRGGGNPDTNFKLRIAIDKAKANNLPAANIERAIRRATGQEAGVSYEEAIYEGYGPGGTAVYMEILTDNRNRTAGEVRHIFSRHGGSLGETGCVAWMFEPKGRIVLGPTDLSEEDLLGQAIEAGADIMRPCPLTHPRARGPFPMPCENAPRRPPIPERPSKPNLFVLRPVATSTTPLVNSTIGSENSGVCRP